LGLITHGNSATDGTAAAVMGITGSVRSFITFAMMLTVCAQLLFLANFLWSLFRGERVEEENPWRATTLEWSISSPAPADDFGPQDPVVYRGAYEFSVPGLAEDFVPQHLAPDQIVKAR
jgi:cytochrome c oxidase subunit I